MRTEASVAGDGELMVNQPKASAWHVAILVIVGLGAYANAIPNGFVHDDHKLIEEESRITGPIDIHRIFQTNYWGERLNAGLYRPLTVLSFAVNHAAFGLEPAAFHAVNVLLHAGASVALYFLLFAIFRSAPVAFGASILFALHPVHTEAVSGVVGRSEVLAALFGFLSLRLALPPFSLNRLGFSLASLLLALLSKENAVVFLGLYPLALVLAPGLEWRRREAAITFGCLAAVAGSWFLLRWSVIGSFLAPEGYVATFLVNPLAHLEPAPRWAAALAGLGKYLLILLLPANLSADYSYDQIPFGDDLSWIRISLSAAMIAALVVTAVRWRQIRPAYAFGVGWFFIAILPTSNLLFPIGSIFAERFLYLPSVGYCIVLGSALDQWRMRGGLQGKLAIGSLVAISLLYAAGTVDRNRDWATDETLMVSVVKNAPNSAMGRY
ncbi:MAG: hypothetical protein O6952_02365, partial [Planctomycetota bacterium]|nr:hypothetical protein [Planctomycetota bacterium]